MLYTSENKLQKLGWLYKHSGEEFQSSLKQQKFLFFYEVFSKINNKSYDFSYLKAYPNGPVYSEVYGDSVYRSPEFKRVIREKEDLAAVDDVIANVTFNLIKSYTDRELSDLTHILDMWKCKEKSINNGKRNIPILEQDISPSDVRVLENLWEEYLYFSSQDYEFITEADKIFVINKHDYRNLSTEHYEIIELLSREESLENPVYLELEDGVLLVD